MPFNTTLAQRIRQRLARKKNLREQRMFGCLAFLHNDHAFAAVWKDSLVVRVGPEDYHDALLEANVSEFDITGRPMTGWVVVANQGIQEDDALADWIQRGLSFVATLPARE